MRFFGNDKTLQGYHKKLSFEIIFQVKFQDLLKIASEVPLDFQYEMRNQGYPSFTMGTSSQLPAEIQQVIPETNNLFRKYMFSSVDVNDPYQIHLGKDFVSLTYIGPYEKDNDFKNRFSRIIEAFMGIYEVLDFTQVGLRHRNIISRITIPKTDIFKIKSFVPDYIFPELSGSVVNNQNVPQISALDKRYVFVYEGIIINANYLWVKADGYYGQNRFENELSYVIDIDCYSQSKMKGIGVINELYDKFNKQYSNVFDWSVSPSFIEFISS